MSLRIDPATIPDEVVFLLEGRAADQARESFWAFRQYMNPGMKKGWWQRRLARRLQRFAEDLLSGTAPMLAIQAPPQHGKSFQVIDLIGWLLGKNPDLMTIYASFSDRLGVRANLRLQRMMSSPKYARVFPETRIGTKNVVSQIGKAQRNKEIVEMVGREGYFRNTTVLGSVTGEGLGLGVIDDPIKGRAAARSPTNRNNVWDWFTDDFFTRFSEEAGLLWIMTRWHVDDPLGRATDIFPEMEILSFPALATEDEYDEAGELLRFEGDPLFPELKSRDFILKRKRAMASNNFDALYQQDPRAVADSLFPVDLIQILDRQIRPSEVAESVRYWDKAGTRGAGAYTAGVLMHALKDGRFCVGHVHRKQYGYAEREAKIKEQARTDDAAFGRVTVYVEQEPGSGGKESAQRTIANLAGHVAHADRPSGDKELRAEPFAVQVQSENVVMCPGTWNQPYLDELEDFPGGKFKDQVDASSGAFAMLVNDGPSAGALW